MRMEYFKLGDIIKIDELNAISTIIMEDEIEIEGHIKFDEDGYIGVFANYMIIFDEDTISIRNKDILIKNPNDYITVECSSNFNCYYVIEFGNQKYVSNQQNQIIIPLNEFEEDEIINNDFIVKIKYKKPYISSIDGDDGINLTSELKELIRINDDGYELELTEDLVHNIQDSIQINKEIRLYSKNEITIDGNELGQLFNIQLNGKLYLDNIKFENFKEETEDGAIIFNNGELHLNNCNFENNENENNDGIIYSNGMIYSENCTFKNCKSKNGGAIFVTSE